MLVLILTCLAPGSGRFIDSSESQYRQKRENMYGIICLLPREWEQSAGGWPPVLALLFLVVAGLAFSACLHPGLAKAVMLL